MSTPFQPLPCPPGGGGEPGEVTTCCSASISSAALCLPDGSPILLVVRSGCADCGTGPADPETVGWIDPASGAFTPGPAPGGAGSCGPECASVSTLRLCDHMTDDSGAAGGCVPFLRHLVHDCTGAVTASADTIPDGVTGYTPVGEVIDCGECPCADAHKVVAVCDYLPDGASTPFLRHLVIDCVTGVALDQYDTLPDGVTPYAPAGEVGECGQCRPVAMCPQLLGYTGPDTWQMPDGAESLTVTVVCGPVSVTDCAGNATQINECNTSMTWRAPGGDCAPGRLCGPFTVDIGAGGAAYLSFTAPCDLGDVS